MDECNDNELYNTINNIRDTMLYTTNNYEIAELVKHILNETLSKIFAHEEINYGLIAVELCNCLDEESEENINV